MAEEARLSWRIARLPHEQLRLVEENAHFMDAGKFQRLVDNIQRDGALTSVPLAALWGVYRAGDASELLPDGRPVYEVLSGNHRVQAAKQAGLAEIDVMVTDDPVNRKRRTAIQIAHNALVGQDDPAILKRLWDSIGDVDWKRYAGLNDKEIADLAKLNLGRLGEAELQYREMTFLFLPWEEERLRGLLDEVVKRSKADAVILARRQEWDTLLDALADAGAANRIENRATALLCLLDVADRHLTDLSEEWFGAEERPKRSWVPLSSILGTRNVPQEIGDALKRAVDRMVDSGKVDGKRRWEALARMAEAELNGRTEQ